MTTHVSMIRRNVLAHALMFVLGFSFVFVAAGASASAIGQAIGQYRPIITQIFGIIVIFLGLNMLGVFQLPFLAMDKRLRIQTSGASYLTSVGVGIGFAAGWTPCIGPILAALFALASNQHSVGAGATLLVAYALGLAVPFLITAAALQSVLPLLARLKRWVRVVEIVAALLVIGMGLVLAFNQWLWLTGKLYQTFPALVNIGSGPAQNGAITYTAAFVAGFLSFASPCVLPLVPVYLSFLTGRSLSDLASNPQV